MHIALCICVALSIASKTSAPTRCAEYGCGTDNRCTQPLRIQLILQTSTTIYSNSRKKLMHSPVLEKGDCFL